MGNVRSKGEKGQLIAKDGGIVRTTFKLVEDTELTWCPARNGPFTVQEPPSLQRPAGFGFETDEAFLEALRHTPALALNLTEAQHIAWTIKACVTGIFPRSSRLMLSVLVRCFQEELRPGLDFDHQTRTANIDPTKDIENLGNVLTIVDRERATVRMLRGIQEICQRQVHMRRSAMSSDTAKELASYIAFLSIPGGGKSTAATDLLHLALISASNVLSTDMEKELAAMKKTGILQSLQISCEHNMIYRYDFALEGNGFTVDQQFNIPEPASLALRMLYMLLGLNDPRHDSFIGFDGFIKHAAGQPYAQLLFKHLTPSSVEQFARTVWKNKNDPRQDGALIFFLDEASQVFESSKQEQQQVGSGAQRFMGMLTAHGHALTRAEKPLVLLAAGTHLDFSACGQCRDGRPDIMPLDLLTLKGCKQVMQDLLQRMGATPDEGAEELHEILAHLSGGCPRILECLLVAAAETFGRYKFGQNARPIPQDCLDVPAPLLLKVLQDGGMFTCKMLEATCELATKLLLERSPTLVKQIAFAEEHLPIGQAILAQQVQQKTVTREDAVVKGRPDITWGSLENVGLVVMVPVSPDMRVRDAAVQPCRPRMPHLLYAFWNKQLSGCGQLLNVGCDVLHANSSMALQPRGKEMLDLRQLLARLVVRSLFERQDSIALHELLPVPKASAASSFCSGCVVKIPTDFTVHTKQSMSTDKDIQEAVRNKQPVRAFVGLGQAKESDWWLILDVDQEGSGDSWWGTKTLVIRGQSKLLQHAGKGRVTREDIADEYTKCFKDLSTFKAKGLFVLVTDVQVDHAASAQQDVLLVGKSECDACYGVAGSLKRKILEDVWAREVQ